MKTQDERGMLTKAIQEKAKKFLGREIDTTELGLYPYLDFCWKNGGYVERSKLAEGEMNIIERLEEEGYCKRCYDRFNMPTREFYDFVQDILAESYVMFYEIEDE